LNRFFGLLIITAACCSGYGPAGAEEGPLPRPEGRFEVVVESSHLISMRDSVRLSSDVYLPAGQKNPLSVILMRTPYNKLGTGTVTDARFFASHGYAVVVQDVRGKWESEGIYEFYSHDLQDFEDTIDWVVSQSWAGNKVGTYGCSYLGEIQIIQATTLNPHLSAAIPQASAGGTGTAGGRYRYFSGVNGGAYELHQGLGWFPRAGIKYHPVAPPGIDRDQL
jgi:putative CocE/NonD family hydrolase